MSKEEIISEIENMKWLIKNTSPTWDEMEFYIDRLSELNYKLEKLENKK